MRTLDTIQCYGYVRLCVTRTEISLGSGSLFANVYIFSIYYVTICSSNTRFYMDVCSMHLYDHGHANSYADTPLYIPSSLIFLLRCCLYTLSSKKPLVALQSIVEHSSSPVLSSRIQVSLFSLQETHFIGISIWLIN